MSHPATKEAAAFGKAVTALPTELPAPVLAGAAGFAAAASSASAGASADREIAQPNNMAVIDVLISKFPCLVSRNAHTVFGATA
jgi:hypothetical protein